MVTIVQSEDKVLRKISKEVPVSSIKNPKIQKILHEIFEPEEGKVLRPYAIEEGWYNG